MVVGRVPADPVPVQMLAVKPVTGLELAASLDSRARHPGRCARDGAGPGNMDDGSFHGNSGGQTNFARSRPQPSLGNDRKD